MKDKYFNLVMSLIAVCLLYIAFLKPTPQRYEISRETNKSETENVSYFTTDIIIFDTATAIEYVFHSLQTLNSEDGTSKTEHSYYVRDQVRRKIIHKDVAKDFDVIGWKEK